MKPIKALAVMATLFAGCVFAQQRMISHVTSATGGFTSTVVLENTSVVEQSYTLTPYDRFGNMLPEQQGQLAGGQTLQTDAAELFEGAAVSHFEVEADGMVAVAVSYNFGSGEGSPSQVSASAERASNWRIFPGNWATTFDGLAVVNTGSEPTDVWISHRDLDGNYLKSLRVAEALDPGAKALYIIGEPDGSPFDAATGYFEVTGDNLLALTALRGTPVTTRPGYLWSSRARAMSLATSTRDDRGVWFIEDGSLYDVFEMMGYNVTVDRLWQSDLFRRNGLGRLAEFFGEDLVGADRLTRAMMYTNEELEAEWLKLDEETRTMMKAYADGANRRVSQVNSNDDIMPYEYKSLNLGSVEPWHYTHVMAWLAQLQRTFSLNNLGIRQITNGNNIQRLLSANGGDQTKTGEMFNDFYWTNDADAPTMIPTPLVLKNAPKARPPIPMLDPNAPDMSGVEDFQALLEENERQLKRVGAYVKGGSYAWVVSGDKTDTGNPIVYSGPQMAFTAPNQVCEGSIKSDAITVSGMVVPGIPAMVVGRTPNHAWSFQVGHANTWDFYVETQSAINLDRPDVIHVRDPETGEMSTVDHVFNATDHGPIVNRVPLLSWKYAFKGYEFELAKGYLTMARATNIDEFGEGVNNIGASLHVCYADKDGNIGYWMSGRNPVRPEGDYRFPQGLLGPHLEYDISVVHPIPHDRNTAQGWYGGWNTKASVDSDDVTGTYAFGPFHRDHVIKDFFNANDKVSMEDLQQLEFTLAHTFSVGSGGNPWQYLREHFMPVVEANPTEERLAAIDMLENWDGLFTDFLIPETDILTQWVLTRDWLFNAMDKTFVDEMGASGANPNDGTQGDLQAGFHWFNSLLHAMDEDGAHQMTYDWFSNSDAEAPQTKDAIILEALDDALAGNLVGMRNILTFDHELLGLLHTPSFKNRSIYTQAVEVGPQGPVRILSGFALGQSGNILMDEEQQPVFDLNFYSWRDDFDLFNYREFPLFD